MLVRDKKSINLNESAVPSKKSIICLKTYPKAKRRQLQDEFNCEDGRKEVIEVV